MRRHSIMAGVELRGAEVGQFAVAGRQPGVVIERPADVGEAGEETSMVAEELQDILHRQVRAGKTLIECADLFRGLFRLNEGNT